MIQTKQVLYQGPGGPFEGVVSWDDTMKEAMPGVLVAHGFGGQSPFEIEKTQWLAELGYVGFALDMYGQGKRAASTKEAETLMGELQANRPLLSQRMQAALAALVSLPQVDPSKTAAIGFCFGGKCVLDLARSGAAIKAIVSFHGLYDAPAEQNKVAFQAAVLILHGWNDPLATPEQLRQLTNELTDRKVDWQLCAYGHTGHSFTHPKAQAPEKGIVYHRISSQRAWKAMHFFLQEVFG